GRHGAFMGGKRQQVRRPSVLVRQVADAEVKGVQILLARTVDKVLQQQMAATVFFVRRVVGRKNVIEPPASDKAEMRGHRRIADRQRRKMADPAKPAGRRYGAIEALDAR